MSHFNNTSPPSINDESNNFSQSPPPETHYAKKQN